MTTNERSVGDITILDIDGRITIQEGADTFHKAVRSLVRRGRVKLVINLQLVPYIDTTALAELIRTHVTITRLGGTLKLLKPTRHVHELLVVTKLWTVLETFEVERAAIESFRSPPSRSTQKPYTPQIR